MMLQLQPVILETAAGPVEVAVVGAINGPVVLVLHGTPGDWRQGRALAADLAPDHRVVLMSRPGYGRTPLRVGRTPIEQADAAAALLAAVGAAGAIMVGISGGGPAAFEFARTRPECAGLVLCCAVAAHLTTAPRGMRLLAAAPGLWAGAAVIARRRARRRLLDHDAVQARLASGLTATERDLLGDGERRLRTDLLAFAADRVEALSGPGLRNDTRQFTAAGAHGAPSWPPDRRLPVLVLHGGDDDVVPVGHAHFYADSIFGAELQVLPGLGHVIPLTARGRLAAAVRKMPWNGPSLDEQGT